MVAVLEFMPPSVRTAGMFLALMVLAYLLPVTPLRAQNIATLRPLPAELSLRPGETGRVEFILENARDVYGIDVRAAFDPAIVEVVDDDPDREGVQLTSGAFPQPDFVALAAADNVAGTLRYIVTQVNPTPPATGSGVVFAVTFRARAAGQTAVTITQVEMADRDGLLLVVTPGAGSVEVTSGAATGIAIRPNDTPSPELNDTATATLLTSPTATLAQSTTAPGSSPTVRPTATANPASTTGAAATVISPAATANSGLTDGPATQATIPSVEAATGTATINSTVPAAGDTPSAIAAATLSPSSTAVTSSNATATTPPAIIGQAETSSGDRPQVAPTTNNEAYNAPLIVGAVLILALAAILSVVWLRRRGRS